MNLQDILDLLKNNLEVEIRVRFRLLEDDKPFAIRCGHCEWWNTYPDQKTAERALRSHHQHCTGLKDEQSDVEPESWIKAMHNGSNGDD